MYVNVKSSMIAAAIGLSATLSFQGTDCPAINAGQELQPAGRNRCYRNCIDHYEPLKTGCFKLKNWVQCLWHFTQQEEKCKASCRKKFPSGTRPSDGQNPAASSTVGGGAPESISAALARRTQTA